MATVRLEIEYDGSRFCGWAAQPGLRTVQGELESALAKALREDVTLTVAGRTDSGVHAWGQVASFETAADVPADLASRLNGIGPRDVAVTSAAVVRNGFDARRDARSRTYCYRVLARCAPSPLEQGRALWWPHPLDIELLEACAAALPGRHDFTAFTPTETEHQRFERNVIKAEWHAEGNHPSAADAGASAGLSLSLPARAGAEQADGILSFWIEADAFMRNMVRVLVGTMLEVASGRRSPAAFEALLGGASRTEAGETAPAHALYLAAVSY
jgi:tRNA pseudouridine38-40 synthase